MDSWTNLHLSEHGGYGWRAFTHYGFAAQDEYAPLLQAELSHALRWYPIGFVTREETDSLFSVSRYRMVVLQSLTPGMNLYVSQSGQWLASYVPSWYRGYPFRLHPAFSSDVLQIRLQDDLVRSQIVPGFEPFFAPDGTLAPKVEQVMNFLRECREDERKTAVLLQQLSKYDLIVPWDLRVKKAADADSEKVSGYFRVDVQAMKALPGAMLSLLAQTNALSLAYAQMYSLARLEDFPGRYQKRSEPTRLSSHSAALEPIFGENFEDTIRF